nr:unnamed protein product [Digitaria exilis]
MGYGWYCGNSYGDYWEGRTCNWESFPDREQMMRGLATQAEPLRTRTTLEIKEEIRRKNGVPLPSRHNLFGPVAIDYAANYGKPTKFNTGIVEHLIKFWRDNRDKYNFAVTTEGKMKEAEERMQMMREEMLRRENFKFDPLKVYPPGSWEDDRQQYLAYWEGIDLRTIRIKAKLTQMEAMRALVRELPGNKDTIQEDKEMDMDAHIEALVSNLLAHVTKGDDKLRKHVRFAKSCEAVAALVYVLLLHRQSLKNTWSRHVAWRD